MSNSLLTIDMVTKETLRKLYNKTQLAKAVKRPYEGEFAKNGAKIGDSLRVRLPNAFSTVTGPNLSLQNVNERYVNVVIDTQRHADFAFDSSELTLDIDRFSQRYIEPAVIDLVAKIESDGYRVLTPLINNFVGTVGTVPNDLSFPLAAERKLDEFLAPMGDRVLLVNGATNAAMVKGVSGLFQSAEMIKEQYESGYMGTTAGFDWMRSNLVRGFTPGTNAGTVLTNIVSWTDGDQLSIDGFTSATGTVPAGTVITVAGMNAINPQTKDDYGYLMQLTVTEDATISGNAATLTISPSIVSSGPYQNVSAAPTDGKAITWVSGTDTTKTYFQNLAFHPEFATLVMPDMVVPGGVDFAGRDSHDGMSIRIVRQYLIASDTTPCRIDALYGWSMLRPELACRITT